MKSIKFDSFDVKAIATKKSGEEKICDNRISLVTLMKVNHNFFKMDPIPRLSEAVV